MPAITKANLIALAAALKEAKGLMSSQPCCESLTEGQKLAIHTWYTQGIADVCARGNGNFDRARFTNAAGA